MANEDSVLREVDQELAEDRQWAMFRKYGPALIGASAALVLGVGAWQVFDAARTRAANEEAVQFAEAADLLIENETEGRTALEEIAGGGSGYAALAQFRRAASFAASDDRQAAIDIFAKIYNDNGVPQSLRNLARIRAGYLALQDGREAALDHLGSLADRDGAYKPYADEISGLAALKAEDYETALSVFSALSSLPETPPGLSNRAEELLALAVAGKAGVNLSGRFQLDDIIGAVGAAGETGAATEAAPEAEADAENDAGENAPAPTEPAIDGDIQDPETSETAESIRE